MKAAKRPSLALEVRDLRLVTSVAEAGSLTRAGQILHLTQSALSHQLVDLERRLGGRVFERLGRRMVLTPIGERLRDASQDLLASFARVEEDLVSVVAERNAVIRLATECYTCYHWLPGAVRSFQDQFPSVEIRVEVGATPQPLAGLLNGQLDVAVVSDRLPDRRIRLTPLFEDEFVAVTLPDHPWAKLPFVQPEDFIDQHVIALGSPKDNSVYQAHLAPAGVVPKKWSDVQLTEAVVELVRARLGIGILARWAIDLQLRQGLLHAVQITKKGARRQWYVATPNHKRPPAYLDAFVEVLERDGKTHQPIATSAGAGIRPRPPAPPKAKPVESPVPVPE